MPEITAFADSPLPMSLLTYETSILKTPGVVAASPFIDAKGMLTYGGKVSGVEVMGILPKQESTITDLNAHFIVGDLNVLKPGAYKMVIGESLATDLGVMIGDKIILITPQVQSSLLGVTPVYRQFTVAGIFHYNEAMGIDDSRAYIAYADAQKLYENSDISRGFHIRVQDIFKAYVVAAQLETVLPNPFNVTTWEETSGDFFKAVAMEKTMMFIILLLIIAVAAFNLVATLMMVVKEKQADIAILRTMGATPGLIMRIFLVQGALVGSMGVVIGVVLGLLLAHFANDLVMWIEAIFHVQLIPASVYFVDYLPSKIMLSDVVHVVLIAMSLSIVAALYPAWRAFKTQPAQALRYD
jgi:lipoprotein-releasing system permease protein